MKEIKSIENTIFMRLSTLITLSFIDWVKNPNLRIVFNQEATLENPYGFKPSYSSNYFVFNVYITKYNNVDVWEYMVRVTELGIFISCNCRFNGIKSKSKWDNSHFVHFTICKILYNHFKEQINIDENIYKTNNSLSVI